MEGTQVLWERYGLAKERLEGLMEERDFSEEWTDYFTQTAGLLLTAAQNPVKGFVSCGASDSYANPAYARARLGTELGGLLSFLYYETESAAKNGSAFLMDLVIHMELFLEVYGAFVCQRQEDGRLPEYETIRRIFYWFAFDYADLAAWQYVEALIDGSEILTDGILHDQLPEEYGGRRAGSLGEADKRCARVHEQDILMLLDKAYVSRKLEVLRTAFEQHRERLADCHMPQPGGKMPGSALVNGDGPAGSGEPGHDGKLRLWTEYRTAVKRIHREMLNTFE